MLDPIPTALVNGENVGNPLLASNGSGYYVTWRDRTIARGRRLSSDGMPLPPDLLFPDPRVNALYWSGRNYMALSSTAAGVRAVRITNDGVSPGATHDSPAAPLQFPLENDAPRAPCDAHGASPMRSRRPC